MSTTREALENSQSLLAMIYKLNTNGSVGERDWENGGVGGLIEKQISENRFTLNAQEPVANQETIKILLDLLNPLHGELDRQTYDQKRENFDAPDDAEWSVNVTARMERDLTQAVLILENRLRHD
jgi:hypothetical protein